MLLRKAQGGSGVGPYFWENDGDVVEVADELANELLAIRGGDFEFVAPEPAAETPTKAATKTAAPAAEAAPAAPAAPAAAPAAAEPPAS